MTTTNNTLVHKYLVPLIENIDFDGCEDNSNIKAVISKLMTIAKNTMKKEKEPGDTTDFKIDEMKGAVILSKPDQTNKTDQTDQTDKTAEPKKKAEPKKNSSDQSDESDENESSDDSSNPPKEQAIERKVVRTPSKNDDSDVDEVNTDSIDISVNSDIDDPASDEE